MKKISLGSVKEYLSRDEQRQVTGGSGASYCRCHGGGVHATYYTCSYCYMLCPGNFSCY